jgi:hypothetical protein
VIPHLGATYPAAPIAYRARYARFTLAEVAEEGDPGFKPSGILEMSVGAMRHRCKWLSTWVNALQKRREAISIACRGSFTTEDI